MMTPTHTPPTERKFTLAKRIYGPRVVGMLLSAVCVGGALLGVQSSPWVWLVMLCNGIVWPHLAYRWASAQADPNAAEERHCLFDSAMAGFWFATMHFQVLPGLTLLAMPTMNAAGVGGRGLLLRSLLASAAGSVVGGWFWGWQFNPSPSLTAQLLCAPLMLLYPILFGSNMYQMLRHLDRQREALRYLSERDGLTGVYSRRFFEQRITQEFDSFQRHGKTVALVMVDIDDLKLINDSHGHTVGDELIRQVGKVLLEQARRADVVARFGGDEFVLLLPFTGSDEALEFVRRVQAAFALLAHDDARFARSGMSFGIALAQADMEHHEHWIAKADAALYRVKSRQRGSVEVAQAPSAAVALA